MASARARPTSQAWTKSHSIYFIYIYMHSHGCWSSNSFHLKLGFALLEPLLACSALWEEICVNGSSEVLELPWMVMSRDPIRPVTVQLGCDRLIVWSRLVSFHPSGHQTTLDIQSTNVRSCSIPTSHLTCRSMCDMQYASAILKLLSPLESSQQQRRRKCRKLAYVAYVLIVLILWLAGKEIWSSL